MGLQVGVHFAIAAVDGPLLCERNILLGDACTWIAGCLQPWEENWADHYLKHIYLMADSKCLSLGFDSGKFVIDIAASALHHIIIRGIEGRKMYRDDADLEIFSNRLAVCLLLVRKFCSSCIVFLSLSLCGLCERFLFPEHLLHLLLAHLKIVPVP